MKQLALLHKRVIHDEFKTCSMREVRLEDQWVKNYPYDTLEGVCSECFGSVDRFVTPAMEIELDVVKEAN